MILTVTLNTALDVSYDAEGVTWSAVNRVSAPRYRAAGQGVIVARVLHAFGHEVTVAGLAGGATAELIKADLARSGVPAQFTPIGRESRRVVTVTDTQRGGTTSFREPVPFINTEELGRFAADYRRLIVGATAVVLCGSLPAGLPPEMYGTLATYASDAGVPVILHASGSPLRFGVVRRPALVVPDLGPGLAADRRATGPAPLHPREFVASGVGAVVVPAGHGVVAISATGQWRAQCTPGTTGAHGVPGAAGAQGAQTVGRARWSAGALGALAAGLVPGLLLDWSWPDRLRSALALAAAADDAGVIDIGAYERFVADVVVEPVPAVGSPQP